MRKGVENDVCVVLGHELSKGTFQRSYSLSKQTEQRTRYGVGLMMNHLDCSVLIMSGGCENLYDGQTIAREMEDYALNKGVEQRKILQEPLSRDSVGQLVFSKQGVIDVMGWKKIILTTHKYHHARVKEITNFVFGGDGEYKINYDSIPNGMEVSKKEIEQEQGSLDAFRETFSGVLPGDDEAILERMLEQHPRYNQEPEDFRERLEELKKQAKIKRL